MPAFVLESATLLTRYYPGNLIYIFKQFLLRGNVVDLAVGVVVGAAFGTVVNALVSDLLTPFIAAIAKVPDFSQLSFTLNGSKFMLGHFINAIISFALITSAVFFFIVKPMNILVSRSRKEAPVDPTTKKCSECLSEIPLAVKRCMRCAQLVS
ncbi:MAG: large conductance mechanosensitive channel protein MscL [bacterium]|nr:large conductance mechanosensitive channel protein MscL [bacterium]MDO8742451.1 large conductance mechanosensitive channel protein MscL [bacterium]